MDERRKAYGVDQLKHEQADINKGKGKAKWNKKGKLDTKGKGNDKGGSGAGQRAQQLKKQSFNVFCFKASGSKQFLFALVRQPSLSKAQGLENV